MFSSFSTRQVVWSGFTGAAVVCLALAAVGIGSMVSLQKADAELQSMQDLSLRLGGSVLAMNEVILTGDAKSSREGLTRQLDRLQKRLADDPPDDAKLKEAVQNAVDQLAVMSTIPKPAPDNDDAMIAYGKLASLSEAAIAALEAAVDQRAVTAHQQSSRLKAAMSVAAGASLLLVTFCAVAVQKRLSANLGGELEHAQALMQRAGQGDLRPVVLPHPVPPHSILGALSVMVDRLRHSLDQVQLTALQITSASSEIAAGSKDLSQRTEMNAASLQQTASAMEEFSATLSHTASSAHTAQQLSATASSVAGRGCDVVNQVVATMTEIQDSSNKIGDIIGTVDAIAFQTNILALNAAVEAARAGEQGRGFAVVASEVRTLAGRSAEAAKEIKSLINASIEQVEQGSRVVGEAGDAMNAIVNNATRIDQLMAEIANATKEQAAGVNQVGAAVHDLDQNTQQNAALVEETAAAASALSDQAARLAEEVSFFKLK